MNKPGYIVDNEGCIINTITIQVDEEGKPLELLNEHTIITELVEGLYRAKWNGLEWVEDISQEEIDELNKQPIKEPTEIEILKQEKEILAKSVYDLTNIVELILTGGITE